MALTTTQIWKLEVMLRLDADKLRKAWPENPADVPAVKQHGEIMRAKAASLDMAGDLLLGMQGLTQGEFDSVMGLLRLGFKRLSVKPEVKPEAEVEAA